MNFPSVFIRSIAISAVGVILFLCPVHAAKDASTPDEYGVYAKTDKGLVRIITNVLYDDQNILYIESNKPPHFNLKAIEYFVIYGKHDMQYLTLNSLKPFDMGPLNIPRFMIGPDIPLTVQKKSDLLYTARPKGLFGRGYYTLWINDSVWDFIIE